MKYFTAISLAVSTLLLSTVACASSTIPTLSVQNTIVNENVGVATIHVTKAGANNGQNTSFTWTTTTGSAKAGLDYTFSSGTVTLSPDQTGFDIKVPIVNDTTIEQQEKFYIILSKPVNATVVQNGVVTINDDDATTTPPVVITPPTDTIPPPTETATDNPMTGQSLGVGAPDIPTTDFDVNLALKPSWDCIKDASGKSICGQPAPDSGDILGAFRFICGHVNLENNIAYDDPTVFHNQPGKSHLHDQTGVENWNAYSNYSNLREHGGGSGCNNVAGDDKNINEINWAANRTPYWQPALLDGKGNVIVADYTSFYYKARPFAGPKADPIVTDPSNPKYQGKGVMLPNGIKFVFGPQLVNGQVTSTSPLETPSFSCVDPAGHPVAFDGTFAGAVQCVRDHNGTAGAGYQLKVNMSAPTCWDGVHLDTADHRSHLAYVAYGNWGYPRCDAAHPYVIPAFTYAAEYTILASDDGDIHFSSDEMDNSKPRGWSFHVDYGPAAWDPKVLQMWTDGCVNSKLNCSGGDLGNGLQLKGADQPRYYDAKTNTWTNSWRNPHRLMPIPPKPSTSM